MPNKNSLFAGNKPTAHLGRNGFDGSAARIFTMRPAVIRPVFYQHTVPNSSYRIQANDIVRASALQTAAFLRGKHELDFYFIPYSMIQSNANDIILQRGDTPTLAAQLPNDFRTLNLQYLVQWAAIPYLYYRWVAMFKTRENYTRSTFVQGVSEFIYTLLGNNTISQNVLYNWFNCFYYEQITAADDTFYMSEFNMVGSDCLTLLSTLGYGDYYLSLKIIIDNIDIKYEDASNLTDMSELASAYFDVLQTYVETLSQGSYVATNMYKVNDARTVNVLPLFAYQKVWREFYRDSINDDSILSEYASTGDLVLGQYNFGRFSTNFDASECPLMTYLRPRRRMYKRDLATGLYASAQYGDAGTFDINNVNITGSNKASSAGTALVAASGNLYNNQNGNSFWNIPSAASAYEVKYAFAMQKFRETLLRAGNRTKDVLMAEFGVRSEYVEHNMPKYLGSFSGSLDLNKVAATSDAGDYSVGDLGGNVFSSLQGSTINFTCNDYGIVIGFMSFVTDPLHNAFGVDAMNIKSTGMDFYHEAFANLGLQPVSSERFSLLSPSSADDVISQPFTLGFAARDIEYKQNTDFVFDNFCTSPLFSKSLIDHINSTYGASFRHQDGSNTNYVSVKNLSQTLSMSKDRTYLLPNCMDTIFKSLDNGTVENAHFDVCLQVTMSEVLPMPVTGLM